METPQNTTNTKEFEVTGVSRSGRVRKKSSKLLDFQSPDEVEKKVYKRTTNTPTTTKMGAVKYTGRGRPSLAALKARRDARLLVNEGNDESADDEEVDEDVEDKDDEGEDMDIEAPLHNTDADDDEEHLNDSLHNTSGLTVSDSDDDGFGELVADLVGTEAANIEGSTGNPKTQVRQSLYMTEKNTKRMEGRLERKDKGKARYTAYSMWARENRKSSIYGKPTNISKSTESIETSRRLSELWSNVSIKEKNAWRRKAKIQSTRAKQRERAGITTTTKYAAVAASNIQNSFINRPTTSRTRKLAEDKQKHEEELAEAHPLSAASTSKRARNNSYRRNQNTTQNNYNATSSLTSHTMPLYATSNGGTSSTYNSTKTITVNNVKTPLPTVEPIDAAAHLKLLGESLSIIGDRLKEHEGQIAVSGSLSVLLDSLLCSLGPLLCLTTRLPGLDKKPQLKANLATTLDNIAYVMPGL